MKKIESPEGKIKKENLTKFQKDVLKSVGCDSIETLEELLDVADPNSDTTEAMELVLAELKSSKPRRRKTLESVPEALDPISSVEVSDKGPGSEKEATEYFEAAGKVEQEEADSEEDQPLNKKKDPWVFSEEAKKEAAKKGMIEMLLDGIRKLFE